LSHTASNGPRPESAARCAKLAVVDALWLLLAIVVCAGLFYAGYRIEPHRVSKDGRRFLCTGQWISAHGDNEGRRREVWISVLSSGQLEVDVKKRLHHEVTTWALEGKGSTPPPRRAAYVLRTPSEGATQRMILTMPAKSRAVGTLDALLPSSKL
jgi:hypothetical protein